MYDVSERKTGTHEFNNPNSMSSAKRILELSRDAPPTFEEMIAEQGGWGKFQTISFLTICFAINTTGWLNYQYTYLLLYPAFNCDIWTDVGWEPLSHDDPDFSTKCFPDYFCKAENLNVTIRYSRDESST